MEEMGKKEGNARIQDRAREEEDLEMYVFDHWFSYSYSPTKFQPRILFNRIGESYDTSNVVSNNPRTFGAAASSSSKACTMHMPMANFELWPDQLPPGLTCITPC